MEGFDRDGFGVLAGPVCVAIVAAAMTSAVLVGLIRRSARSLGLVDVPNARSSHQVPTPRGGGLGVLAGMSVAIAMVSVMASSVVSRNVVALIACSLVVGIVGLIDDRNGLSARVRLGFHLSAAAAFVGVAGSLRALPLPQPFGVLLESSWVSFPLTVLWVTTVTNFFNFMDGVDGLAGGQAIVSCAGVVMAGFSADAVVAAAALGGASAGFLIYNWPPARVFMGDVGSGSIGFMLGGLPLLAPPEKRPAAVLAIAIGLTFFILDPVLTLRRRALRREAVMTAHREHLYQRLIPAGTSGRRVTTSLLAGATSLSVLGALTYQDATLGWIGVCLSMTLFAIEFVCSAVTAR